MWKYPLCTSFYMNRVERGKKSQTHWPINYKDFHTPYWLSWADVRKSDTLDKQTQRKEGRAWPILYVLSKRDICI